MTFKSIIMYLLDPAISKLKKLWYRLLETHYNLSAEIEERKAKDALTLQWQFENKAKYVQSKRNRVNLR